MNTHFTLPVRIFSKLHLAFSISQQGERLTPLPLSFFNTLLYLVYGVYNFTSIWQNAGNRLSSVAINFPLQKQNGFGSDAKCDAFAALELPVCLQGIILEALARFCLARAFSS